jgi:branched-subunit amino acid aminotransferase/4-amino-4-deoxychorismate lyase
LIAAIDRDAGVFETVRMREGRLIDCQAHLRRLAQSAEELFGLQLPDRVGRELGALPRLPRARIRVAVWPLAESLAWKMEAEPYSEDGPPPPLTLVPLTVAGGLGCHKWRDRSWLAAQRRARARRRNVELLLLDVDGEVLETERAAVLLVEGDRLVAAPDDARRLPSLTRRRLLSAADAAGLEVSVERIDLKRLLAADLVMAGSSIRLVARIAGCGRRRWRSDGEGRGLANDLFRALDEPVPTP